MNPIIVSYLTVKISKLEEERQRQLEDHICYVQLWDSQTQKTLFETYIKPSSRYNIVDTMSNFQVVDKRQIEEGMEMGEAKKLVREKFDQDQYYCGYKLKYFTQQFKIEILQSHIMDLSHCECFQGTDKCNSYFDLLINSGEGFIDRIRPEELGKTQMNIYNRVKYKFDFEVAQYWKHQQAQETK